MGNNNPTNENTTVSNDAWVDELIAWADENKIPEEKFPRDKEALLNLTELNLNECSLSTLPESFGNLTNLTSLSLYKNQLSTLPESFGDLTNLTELNLYGNVLCSLYDLPESVCDLLEKWDPPYFSTEMKKFAEFFVALAKENQTTIKGDGDGEFLTKKHDTIDDVCEWFLSLEELEIQSVNDFDLPIQNYDFNDDEFYIFQNIERIVIKAPITKLNANVLLINDGNLSLLDIRQTNLKSYKQIEGLVNDVGCSCIEEILLHNNVYEDIPSLKVGGSDEIWIFCFDKKGLFKFTRDDDDTVLIPCFRHDGDIVYTAQGEIRVGDFKEMLYDGISKFTYETAPSFREHTLRDEDYFDAKYYGNGEHYFIWRGDEPKHYCEKL